MVPLKAIGGNINSQDLNDNFAYLEQKSNSTNADTVDGFHANIGKTANTIPVRDETGKVPGSITGNAETVGGKEAGTGAGNVLVLDINGKVPDANLASNIAKVLSGGYKVQSGITGGMNPGVSGNQVLLNNIVFPSLFINEPSFVAIGIASQSLGTAVITNLRAGAITTTSFSIIGNVTNAVNGDNTSFWWIAFGT